MTNEPKWFLMKKEIKILQLLAAIAIFCKPAICQVNLNGPTCVVPGVIYQYTITSPGTSSSPINMKVCVTNGTIVDKDQKKLGDCVQSSDPFSTVFVAWYDATASSITISSLKGNKTSTMNMTVALQPGELEAQVKNQNLTDTLTVPSTIKCAGGRGGSCSPAYLYQWQQSADALTWSNIAGATGLNLSFTGGLNQPVYYRRKITETHSGTIGYSEIAAVNVLR